MLVCRVFTARALCAGDMPGMPHSAKLIILLVMGGGTALEADTAKGGVTFLYPSPTRLTTGCMDNKPRQRWLGSR